MVSDCESSSTIPSLSSPPRSDARVVSRRLPSSESTVLSGSAQTVGTQAPGSDALGRRRMCTLELLDPTEGFGREPRGLVANASEGCTWLASRRLLWRFLNNRAGASRDCEMLGRLFNCSASVRFFCEPYRDDESSVCDILATFSASELSLALFT